MKDDGTTAAAGALPARRNVALAIAIVAAALFLQWWAARQTSAWAVAGIGVLFSFLLLPLYSLLHEAEHRLFNRDARVNDAFGVALAALFPGSFSFLRACHLGHHRRNRSDVERFELLLPGDAAAARTAAFYALFLGGFWLLVPLATVALVVWPRLLRAQIVQDAPEAAAMVNGVRAGFVRRIRLESLAVVALHVALFFALELRVVTVLALYGLFALNWSSQQYVTHAYSPRDVKNGAHNLAAARAYEMLLLNFNWHLAHHQNPAVPWNRLPAFEDTSRARPGYLRAFLRFWRGPRRIDEAAR